MLKKSLIAISIFMVVGCGANFAHQSAEPAYKISDEDVKKLIVEGNKKEQCVFPKQYKTKTFDDFFNTLSPIEQHVTFDMLFVRSLAKVLGLENARMIVNDRASIDYTLNKIKKFNHSEPVNFDKKWCDKQKKEYSQALTEAKRQVKKQKQIELARKKQEEKERKAREAYLKTPAGQMELARMQQERQHQEMMALQRQQIAQQQSMQQQMQWQQFNQQMQQINQQIQQTNQFNMQMMQQMTPQRVIVTPAYQGPCFGTGPCWRNVY